MWVLQVQKDLVDLSKHYIHVIDALVSLNRVEYFALEKQKKARKNSSSKFVSLRSQLCRRIQMYKILCRRFMQAVRTCLFTDTHSYMPDIGLHSGRAL